MKTLKHDCGCISEHGDRERWMSLCDQHQAEADETHARWAAEHRASRREIDEYNRAAAGLARRGIDIGTVL